MSDYAATSRKSSAELEREVEMQRHRISSTIDEIQHKMSPGQLLDGVMDYTKGGGKDFAQNLGRSVMDNPLPVALVGVGLLWLMSGSGTHRSSSDAYTRGSDTGVVDKARHLGEDVSERVSGTISGVAGSVNEMTHDAKYAARDMMQRQTQNLTHLYEDQPLIGGALAFALGAAIGAALPHTRQEDQLLGEAADSVKKEALEQAGDLFEQGREAVEQGYAEIKDTVGSVIEEGGRSSSETGAGSYQG